MKTKFLVLGFLMIFGVDQAVAAPAPLPVSPVSAQGPITAEHIGIIAGVKGNVQITRPGEVGTIVSSGAPIRLGDEITTGPEGNLQILLLDQTIFTIGPNSSMKIDKFVYDPATNDGEVKAQILKGLFRFVTGKIAKKDPKKMEVKLPTGTIGVRGTMVMGEVSDTSSTAVLLGPGEKTNTGSRIGRFILSGEVNGKTEQTEVSRPGYGASINANGVSRAFQVPVQEIARMTQGLESMQKPPQQNQPQGQQGPGPQQGQPQGPRGNDQKSATRQAGQDTMGARGSLGMMGRIGGLFQGFRREGDFASQKGSDAGSRIMDGATNRNQLQVAAQSLQGVFHYSKNGIPLMLGANNVGSYNFQYDIDFGNRKLGGGNSQINGNINIVTNQAFQFNLGAVDFGAGTQAAVYQYGNLPNALSPGAGNCTNCRADVSVGLQNLNGIVGATAQVDVKVQQQVGMNTFDRGSGGGGGAQRENGPS